MIGETISHYKIIEKLGEGGMGVVYKALDITLDRHVAIKFLPPHLSKDEEARKRFIHEAKAASALNHSNIGVIHEIGQTDDGRTFIVMAYYEGETLRERIDRGDVSIEDALEITSQIAAGLARAHEKEIIHRDIKPSNILITRDGEAKIIDFGLAKLRGRTRLTKEGTTLGTVAYMSPEQAKGEEVDHRSDVFSLGVILYELLTGEPPFNGEHEAALLYEIVHETHKPLSESGVEIPELLHDIVDRALEKNPEKRYQRASELKDDLESLKKSIEPVSHIIETRPKRRSSRHWMIATVLVVIAAVVIFILKDRFGTGVVQADELALAVIEFSDLTGTDDPNRAIGMAGLIHVGMVENSPCRVVSPSYLQDIRRRLFGVERGPIEESQALEIARKSGATVLLSGQIGKEDGGNYVVWQLVDTKSGKSVAAKRAEGKQLIALADAVIDGVLPALAQQCGVGPIQETQSITALATADSKAYEYYVAGGVALERYELDEAIRLLENAVALDTTFALAYFDLARAHQNRLAYYETCTNTERAWKWRSRLSIQDRMRLEAWREQMLYRPVAAIKLYRELHNRWPDDKGILKELLYQLFFWWFHRDAIEVCERAMLIYPDEPSFAFSYQTLLSNLSRPREALRGAYDLVARFPENPNHWDELALRFIEAGFPDSAATAFNEALEREPGFEPSERGLAALPYYRGDLEGAVENLAHFLQRDDLSADAKYLVYMYRRIPIGLAWVAYESGRYKRMLDLIDEAGKLRPSPVDRFYHQRYRCKYLLQVGRAHEVLQWVDTEAVKLAAGDGAAANNLQLAGIARQTALEYRTKALVALDSLDAARRSAAALMEAAAEFGNDVRREALFANAQIALKENDETAALMILDQLADDAIGMGHSHINYLKMRAAAYRLAGRLEEAVAMHKELLGVYGGHALSHYELGKLYEEMHCTDDAKVEYEKFLEMWSEADEGLPQLEDARERLAKLKGT